MEIYDRGLRLKELRKKRGLSQKEAAAYLGLKAASISAYESNSKTPSVEILEKMAILYRTSVDYILGLSERTNLYIDDLSKSQQDSVTKIVEILRDEFHSEHM